jgi:tetratricopeptide (TPR) repeat protein/tRNA A-37 threonylcarbamoyl transferase component Bud32
MTHLPDTIGAYRIIGTLGEGGMGTVYEAQQEQPHRLVALKVIRQEFVSPELVRRFSREADVLGRLQHPGIAQIYQAGTFDDGYGARPFFAMELVKGQSLTEYLRAHALDIRHRLELFARICDAVQYAHQQGVIHRDLKPANIMVDATGQPKILDFGVARFTDADVQATRQTDVGEVIGTLQYMSPEQVNADPSNIDTRSDVYSLGVILYEVLSGKLPYDLARKLIYEAVRIIVVDDPARLSSIDRNLGGDVEIIVAKALEKEKARRYGSAEELASDVRRYLNDEPIVARPATAVYQLRKFARRHRALVGGIALAAVALVAGTAVSLWQAVRATAAERVAETRRGEAVAAGRLAERRRALADSALLVADSARADATRQQAAATASAHRATGEAAKARSINEFLQNMLASSDPSNARGKDLSVRDVLDRAAATLRTGDIKRQPEVTAGLESTIGQTYFALGLYDAARPHFDSAYAIRRRTLGPTNLAVGESAHELGILAQGSGDYAQAERRLTEALAIKRATLGPTDDQITESLVTLASVRYVQGKNALAEQLYRKALALTRARHGNGSANVASRLKSLGAFLVYTDRAKQGKPLLEESLAIYRRVYGDTHPLVVDGLVVQSDALERLSQFAAAEAKVREALPIARAVYGKEHPAVANVLSRIGTALNDQHKLSESELLHREALAMRIKLLGEQHPDVQLARVEIGRVLQSQQRFAEADTFFNQALHARRAVLGDSSPAVASSLQELALSARYQGDWAGAVRLNREALPIWRAARIEDGEISSLAELGFALAKQDKNDEAERILTDVLGRQRARYGEGHWAVGNAMEKLASVAYNRGHLSQAESLSVAGLAIRRKVYGERSPQVAVQLPSLAFFREAQNDTAGAILQLREALSILQAISPETDAQVVVTQGMLAIDLCATGATAAGDSLVRSAIAHTKMDSTKVNPNRLLGALGSCLTRERRYADAEPALLQAEAGFRALGPASVRYRKMVVTWLVNLYEQWGKPAEAAAWRGRMDVKQ